MARPADPLDAGGDAGRRLDLQHEVDRTHVDPELQRRCRDETAQLAGLELVLDEETLLARDRAVVRADEVLAGELVETRGQPLGETP